MKNNNQKIQVKIGEGRAVPSYANNVNILHTAEEFVLDFFAVYPPQGVLINRVVISPTHAKRLAAALTENIVKYEKQFHEIKEVPVKFDMSNIVTPEDSEKE